MLTLLMLPAKLPKYTDKRKRNDAYLVESSSRGEIPLAVIGILLEMSYGEKNISLQIGFFAN